MDALDYPPEQALADATEAVSRHDYTGAIIILVNNVDDGPSIEMTHFVSGVTGSQSVSYLELLKQKFALQILGI